MEENFAWNDPYTDLGARNVQDGSLDYFDFQWGSPVNRPAEDAVPGQPGGCPCGPAAPDVSEDPAPIRTDYEIVTE